MKAGLLVSLQASGLTCAQVRFFYPEMQHQAFGVIRAILKDSTDNETGAASLVFLDSDNEVIPL